MPDALVGGLVGFLAACALSYAVGAVLGWVVRWQDRRDREDAREDMLVARDEAARVVRVVNTWTGEEYTVRAARDAEGRYHEQRLYFGDVTEAERRG